MSFKNFSVAQSVPGKEASGDKGKEGSPSGQPAAQPDKKPADVAPAPKS